MLTLRRPLAAKDEFDVQIKTDGSLQKVKKYNVAYYNII